MASSDIVVCSVSGNILIEDLMCAIPVGTAFLITGERAYQSKDLWRLLSQGKLFRLNVHSLLEPKVQREVPPDPVGVDLQGQVSSLEQQVQQLQGELTEARQGVVRGRSALESEIGKLTAEAARLRTELAEEKAKTTKLDQILTLLQDPTRVSAVTVARVLEGKPVDEDIPVYVPSQIKSAKVGESRVEVKEGKADASSVTGAAQALRSARKKAQ
jgi:hypothetical protein